MNTKAKVNSVITHEVSMDADGHAVITFHVRGAGSIELAMRDLHGDIVAHAAIHGMIQRISDAAAISRDPETGAPATPQDKFEAMSRLVGHYSTGTSEWARRPQAGEGRSGGLLFRALCELSKETKTPEEIREWLAGKTKAEQAALRAQPRIAAKIAELKPVSIEADADALLEELGVQ